MLIHSTGFLQSSRGSRRCWLRGEEAARLRERALWKNAAQRLLVI